MTVVKGVNTTEKVNTYLIDVFLPNKIHIPKVTVTEGKLSEKVPFIIGMDIINIGDLVITNANGKTVFSFRIPAVKEIDFVPDAESYNKRFEPKSYTYKQRTVPRKGRGKKRKK